jgi:6-phosphogluconate dehydrogenase
MVHNGIEYGVMQAYAEGWELLRAADVVNDTTEVFRSWREGTVIRSWLLDLAVNALEEDDDLGALRGYAQDSGEGRWTVEAAIDHAVRCRSSPLPCSPASPRARTTPRR